MAFDPNFLDELRARSNLAELVGRRVRLIRRGREHVGLCPFHNEKSPSFTVVEDKGFYHCFGCGAHGDAIGWLMQAEGMAFPEAVERLAGEVGLPVPQTSPGERERATRQAGLMAICEAAAGWFESELRTARGRAALDYLHGRGLDDATIARFRLGYAPDTRTALRAALTRTRDGAAIAEAGLIEAGLLIQPDGGGAPYDRFRGRVMFPITDARGRAIAFGGRVMGEGEPKYLNSPETPLFHKGRVLYGLATAREGARATGRIVVVEGYMDVIALARAGIAEAVAPLGTALTESHLEMLWKLAPEPILCFDGDAAGQRAAARAAERALPALKPGCSLRFALLPAGDDPDSLVRRDGREGIEPVLEGAMALDRLVWQIEAGGGRLDTPERLAGLEKRLEDRARQIADPKVQAQYLAAFRARLREAMWGARRPGGRGAWAPRRPGPSGAAATISGLSRAPVARTDPGRLASRQEAGLMLCLVNHPALAEEFAEELAQVTLSDLQLDKLRLELLKICAQTQGLDSAALRGHLRVTGLSGALAVLDRPEMRAHDGFARPGAEAERARRGLLQVLARLRRGEWRAQLDEAERAWVEDPTEANWARWQDLIEASQRADAEIATVEDDDRFAPGGEPTATS